VYLQLRVAPISAPSNELTTTESMNLRQQNMTARPSSANFALVLHWQLCVASIPVLMQRVNEDCERLRDAICPAWPRIIWNMGDDVMRLDDELRLRLQWLGVSYGACEPWVRGVWRFGCIRQAQRCMGSDDNESPVLSLQDLRPYELNKSHALPSCQGMTERDGATPMVFFEGAEALLTFRLKRKHPIWLFDGGNAAPVLICRHCRHDQGK
jgi:hypothetical protein